MLLSSFLEHLWQHLQASANSALIPPRTFQSPLSLLMCLRHFLPMILYPTWNIECWVYIYCTDTRDWDQNLIGPIFGPLSLDYAVEGALILDCQQGVGAMESEDKTNLELDRAAWTDILTAWFYSLTAWSHFDPGDGCQYSRYICGLPYT